MLSTLAIERFRRFEKLQVDGLTRVNLFVGKNNAGKTALLEAAAILLNQETVVALAFAAGRRHEIVRDGVSNQVFADVRHLFAGHEPHTGSNFRIDGRNGERNRYVSVEWTTAAEVDLTDPALRFPAKLSDAAQAPALLIRRDARPNPSMHSFTRNGGLLVASDASADALRTPREPPVTLVAGDPRNVRLSELWKPVIEGQEEQHVYSILRLVEPALKDLIIIDPEAGYVDLKGDSGVARLPIASMGDGFHYLLDLATQLVQARGGTLLIDELTTGLHYAMLPQLWRLLVEAAVRLDVQVFATTHSKDCLEAVAQLCSDEPNLADQVSIHRLEVEKETSIRLDAARIAEYVAMDLEAR